MDTKILAETLEVLGTLFIAFAALRVHHRFLNEHQVDDQVFKAMKFEQKIGILGAALVVAGYVIRIFG